MSEVRAFEAAFAHQVGAKYCIALCNGTATLHTALAGLGVKPGDKVAVPPLTMASTTIAVLHAGGVPVFVDVDPKTWLMADLPPEITTSVPVDLYGLQGPWGWLAYRDGVKRLWVADSAQTMRRVGGYQHEGKPTNGFISYSFQSSKILSLGEGGALVTDDEELAQRAREFSSLGYRMEADRPGIDKTRIKRPDAVRHHGLGWNYRMNDHTAHIGLKRLLDVPSLIQDRLYCAYLYQHAIAGCSWLTAQYVPPGWEHDYWAYAVALESAELWHPFTSAVVAHGGEMPYGAWRLTYHEPAFRHLAEDGTCPVAEELQPRLVQFQTNDTMKAIRNADAVAAAIKEVGGTR